MSPIISEEEYLAHYGTPRHSGRYPWGSGGNESQRNKQLLDHVSQLRKEGVSEVDIAQGLGMSVTHLRAMRSIAKNEQKQAQITTAQHLKDKGYSNVAIGERMGLRESTVRSLLAPGRADRENVLQTTANMLKNQVDTRGFIDVGSGVEHHIGISDTKLSTAVAMLETQGYVVKKVQVPQAGTNMKTTIKVLAPPGTTYPDIVRNMDKIHHITEFTEDGGRTFLGIKPPVSVDSKRVAVRYAEDGGKAADGVIYVRPGVPDLSLGGARYAQVRIAVDGTHYLKGMAIYKDDLPEGTDLVFNTNKSNTGKKTDAFKPLKDDPDNPFGSSITRQSGVMNIVNEEGDWENWSRTMSSQMLSKQTPALAKSQLDMTYESRRTELDDIKSLTNPAVRRKLLQSYSDGADSAAVHLKAAALPRTRNRVIIPIESLKDTEVYSPSHRNGEKVVLIRHPHGGIFEIPELTVNNNHPEAKKILGNRVKDAIGINSKVAERLSGADFDGDTVLVIPNNNRKVKTAPALAGLKDFDAQREYPGYPGMKKMDARTKAVQMGDVSNLITDMTIKGANGAELARAVRHSMVVIDAEKHGLNYKLSAEKNGIAALKQKYQGKTNAGASTLISKAKSELRVPERKPRSAAKGGPIDKDTGKKVFVETGASYVNAKGKTVFKTISSTKLGETDNAHTLSSGTVMEKVYADHSNKLKALANEARREMVNTKPRPYSPSAKAAYSNEVASLNGKLNVALKNRPLERQAQLLANTTVSLKRQANPDMDKAELKKIKGQALVEARRRTGASKIQVDITPSEWDAIQAGAITDHKLTQILDNADLDKVKQLATPKTKVLMTTVKQRRAQSMLSSGYTQAEIADALGVSLTTLKDSLAAEGG